MITDACDYQSSDTKLNQVPNKISTKTPVETSAKKNIAHSFSSSASSYDQFASLQQQVGANLIDVMSSMLDESVEVLLDVGCGTGFFSQSLVEQFQVKKYIGVDLAQGMLEVAQRNNQILNTTTELAWLCDDAEYLSLADESVDVIYANFSLQWCKDLPQLMKSFHRVLKPNGRCFFTSLDSATLHELRQSWSIVDGFSHVNDFYSTDAWRQAIDGQGFSTIQYYQQRPVNYYHTVRDLLRSLKAIGANTVLGQRQSGLMGKTHFQKFVTAYEQYRQPQGLPVSYYVDGWAIKKIS